MAGANSPPAPLRAHRLCRRSAAGCWRSMPRSRSTAAPIRSGRSRSASSPGRRPATCRVRTTSAAIACRTYCVATNKPGFLPYRGVARTGVCFAMELMIDAIARAVGREPWEVRLRISCRPDQMPYDNVARKHYDSGDYPRACRLAREKIDVEEVRERQKTRRAGRPPHRHRLRDLLRAVGARHQRLRRLGHCRSCRATTRRRCGSRRTAASRCASACIRTARAWKRRWRRSRTRCSASTSRESGCVHGDTGTTPFSTGTYASRSHRHVGRRGGERVQAS